jgi:YD repeat-containing protein
VSTYEFNENGKLTRRTEADGSVFTWTYDFFAPWGLLSCTDEFGIMTMLEGGTATRSTPFGPVATTTTYTPLGTSTDPPAGLVASFTDALGNRAEYTYNAQGLPTEIAYAAGTADEAAVAMEYDAAGNLTARIDKVGRWTVADTAGPSIAQSLGNVRSAAPEAASR